METDSAAAARSPQELQRENGRGEREKVANFCEGGRTSAANGAALHSNFRSAPSLSFAHETRSGIQVTFKGRIASQARIV